MALFTLSGVGYADILDYPFLEIAEGEATFLCGKSGAGKSTLLKLLNATVSPSRGTILYAGQPLEQYDTLALRRQVLLAAQNVFLFDESIRENFDRFYAYRELPPPGEAVMARYLALCQADFSLEANCRTLSGGERQRVFLAICLSFAPRVLLLDEPTSALDGQTAGALLQALTGHCKAQGITLVVVTHDQALAARFASRVINLGPEV